MTQTDRLQTQPAAVPPPTGAEFGSILFADAGARPPAAEEPPFFRDLNLDQVVDVIVDGRDEYELRPFFHCPLREVDAVEYRHGVFRDLDRKEIGEAVRAFADGAIRVRRFLALAAKQRHRLEKQRWFLDACHAYCDAVSAFATAVGTSEPRSRGVQALRDYLRAYTASEAFGALASEVAGVREGLGRVRYTMRIKGSRVTVARYEDEQDYSAEVERTFERFRQGAVDTHLVDVPDSGAMDHVEARIAELVARLYPHEFAALDRFCRRRAAFFDERLARFDREVQFYLAYLEHIERVAGAGGPFCYPTVSIDSKEISADGGFDLALAAKLAQDGKQVVLNDFFLRSPERLVVVTGPNQGGKTTFARMFAQLHYLAALGVPVPARAARLFLPDRVFTHFEREEHISTLRGKLEDELVRVREILAAATGDSVVVLNEIFSATTAGDALSLGANVLRRLIDRGCLAVCVTFIDELSSLGPETASMVAGVDPDDPSRRTFEIARRPADGRAFAWAIASKYGLSYEQIRSRLR